MTEPFVFAKLRRCGRRRHCISSGAGQSSRLITGATGTGRTVTLQVLAENFSRLGVPVFLADVKGDLSGLAVAGAPSPKMRERLRDQRHRRAEMGGHAGGLLGRVRPPRISMRATVSIWVRCCSGGCST
jgi:hypothetical protein